MSDPSGGQVTLSGLSPDGTTGLNAWQIDDQVTFNGGRAHYNALFTPAEVASAANTGWELSLNARVFGSSGIDTFCEFATGTDAADDRYLIFLTDMGTDVEVNVFLAGITYTCVGGNDGNYHTFAIRKPAGAANVDAEFYFDGVSLGALPRGGSNGNAPDGGVNWGSGSSGATGTVNVNRAEFAPLTGGTVGTNYCTPNVNSTGQTAILVGTGSAAVVLNDLTVRMDRMPFNSFGYFLVSRTQGFTANPNMSSGNLCLGGSVGRYVGAGQIKNSGAVGFIDLDLNLMAMPTPTGLVPAMPGQTWNFQGWHRDTDSSGGLTSNFSDGLSVAFQ